MCTLSALVQTFPKGILKKCGGDKCLPFLLPPRRVFKTSESDAQRLRTTGHYMIWIMDQGTVIRCMLSSRVQDIHFLCQPSALAAQYGAGLLLNDTPRICPRRNKKPLHHFYQNGETRTPVCTKIDTLKNHHVPVVWFAGAWNLPGLHGPAYSLTNGSCTCNV